MTKAGLLLLIYVTLLSFWSRATCNESCTAYNALRSHTVCSLNETDDINRPHIACLILARGGSKGIHKKNLAQLNGTSLLRRSLSVARTLNNFSSVWVSTDDAEIAQEATNSGAMVHWRSAHTATDDAPSLLAVQEFVKYHPEVDIVGLVQCTSPFLKADFLDKACNLMQTGRQACVFSVTREHKLRWKETTSQVLDVYNNTDGELKPLNFDPCKRHRRQDWAGELVENGMFYFATKQLIWKGMLQDKSCAVVEIPKIYSYEIDTPFDLQLAEALLGSQLFV